MRNADHGCIVVGVGAVGSAVLWQLARRGIPALGIERFEPGHANGSSHGETRVIRTAYHEHPAYVPLLQRAHALWRELQSAAGERLYWETGVLEIGPPDGEVVPGVLESARAHGLSVQELGADEVERRFPGFSVPAGSVGVFERQGGVLSVERCVEVQARLAQQGGAELWSNTEVESWRVEAGRVVLETSRGRVTSERLVLAVGPWAPAHLASLGVEMRVLRKPLLWHRSEPGAYSPERGSPVFLYERRDGVFYGFPALEDGVVKVAEHSGGAVVADPLRLKRTMGPEDAAPVASFLSECLPQVDPQAVVRSAVCMYTMSPDGHFLVGEHPGLPQVAFAAALSGHGFKFTSALGEVLAEWASGGRPRHSIDVFSPSRFGDGSPTPLEAGASERE